jgi:hypothetical protein
MLARQLEVLRIRLSQEQLNLLFKHFMNDDNNNETNIRKLKEVFNRWENTGKLN